MSDYRPHPRNTYDKKIFIETFVYPADDDFGQSDRSDDANWEPHFDCHARLMTRGGTAFSRALREQASDSVTLRVPYGSEVAAAIPHEFRIQFGTRTLKIISAIDVDDMHQEIEFACAEFVEATA